MEIVKVHNKTRLNCMSYIRNLLLVGIVWMEGGTEGGREEERRTEREGGREEGSLEPGKCQAPQTPSTGRVRYSYKVPPAGP